MMTTTNPLELHALRSMLLHDVTRVMFCQGAACDAILDKRDAVSLTIGAGEATVVCGRCWRRVRADVLAALASLPDGSKYELLDGRELWKRDRTINRC